jgi:ribosome biogenesis SPOUT family RNA methylase Rps3
LIALTQSVESNDLLNRCLLLEQPEIPPEKRRTEKELNQEFDRINGKVLGGLLDLLSTGIADLPNTTIDTLPRMADSVLWITACLGDDSFPE